MVMIMIDIDRSNDAGPTKTVLRSDQVEQRRTGYKGADLSSREIIQTSFIQSFAHVSHNSQPHQISFKMLASTIITALIGSSLVAAAPADVSARQVTICSGTYNNAQCCATDVLGLADLNCANRESYTTCPLAAYADSSSQHQPSLLTKPTSSASARLRASKLVAAHCLL